MRRISRDDAPSTETTPLLDGDVIAHSEQPLSYCLLLSCEGRLKNLLFLFHLVFQWVVTNILLHRTESLVSVGSSFKHSLSESMRDWASRQLPKVCEGEKKSVLSPKPTHGLFILFIYLCNYFFFFHSLHLSAPAAAAAAACHIQRMDCHVYSDGHDRNLFSCRFTPDMGNATLLMVTRPHPEKPSRVEWGTGWRSCWISSRMSICPSGERQVSLKTICPT